MAVAMSFNKKVSGANCSKRGSAANAFSTAVRESSGAANTSASLNGVLVSKVGLSVSVDESFN